MYLYQASGLQRLAAGIGVLKFLGGLADVEQLSPLADPPFFFGKIGKTFPAEGAAQYRVAFLAGCIANVSFARLNEATVRVLQKNGCEVVIPAGQGCCGALHVHAGSTRRRASWRAATSMPSADEVRCDHHQRRRLRVHAEGV